MNGTFVNGQRIGRTQLLARADVIRIGNDEFRFYADAAAAPAAPGPGPPRPSAARSGAPTGAGHQLSDTMHGLPVSELRGVPTPPAAESAAAGLASWCAAARFGASGCRSSRRW